jgi:hypothetical protein
VIVSPLLTLRVGAVSHLIYESVMLNHALEPVPSSLRPSVAAQRERYADGMRKEPEPLVNTVLVEFTQYGHGVL